MKKLLLIISFLGFISFSNNVIGPRYRLEISQGAISGRENKKFRSFKFSSSSISVLPEWKIGINEKFDVTFGPKMTLNVALNHSQFFKPTIRPSLIFGVEADLNYKIRKDIKIYTGIESGIGIGFQIFYDPKDFHFEIPEFTSISKISFGFKIKDKFNIALYTGDIKGMLGIEAGYTF
ncbi:hypothetical protein [Streptobacillus moniliformis]|uniref:hypothetical protein n=2 Tax=Streptobacillus moniliformis TaxID=34105 RepID=UPI0007E2ED6B|nr:hypothetical protein [Streptobacillus moniliformis]